MAQARRQLRRSCPSVFASRRSSLAFALRRSVTATAWAVVLGLSAMPAMGATYWWNTADGLWSNTSYWSNAASGGNTGTVPVSGTADTAIFNQTAVNGNQIITLGANTQIGFIQINNTGSTTFRSDSTTSRVLTISGITVNAGAGPVTIGDATNPVRIGYGPSSTIANNSSSLLTILNGVNLSASTQAFGGSGNIDASQATFTGATSWSKSGSGTMTLSSSNSYTGGTTISGGVLSISSIKSVGGGNSSLGAPTTAASGTISFNGSGTLLYTGSGDTTDRGLASLSTAGAGSIFTIDQSGAGLLKFTSDFISGYSGASNGNIATLAFQGSTSGSGEFGGVIKDSATAGKFVSVTKAGTGKWTLSGANTYSGTTGVSGGVLAIAGSGRLGASGVSAVTLSGGAIDLGSTSQTVASVTISAGAASGDTIYGGTLSGTSFSATNTTGTAVVSANLAGSGSVSKSGAGVLVLSGSNTNSGTTSITGGILRIAGTSALYSGSSASWTKANITTATNATFAVNVGGSGEFTTSQVSTLITNLTGNVSTGGMKGGSRIGFDTTNATGTFTLADIIADGTSTGGGPLGLTKLGSGVLALTATNTFTGPITISGGTLQLGGSSVLGPAGTYGGSAISIASGAAFEYASSQNQMFPSAAGSFTGAGALVKSGSGTLSLYNNNSSWSGNLFLTSGTTEINATSAAGTGMIFIGGTSGDQNVRLQSPFTRTYSNPITVQAGGSGTKSIVNVSPNSTPTVTFSGSVVLNNDVVLANTGKSDAALQLSGTVSGTGGIGTTGNIGTVQLLAANTYSGTTSVSAGRFLLSNQFASQNSTLNVTSGTVVFDSSVTGSAFTIGGLAGSGTVTLANNAATPGAIALTAGGNNADTTYSGRLSDAGSLVKVGSGRLTLSASSSFSGGTTLSDGSLEFASNALGSGNVTLNGGTLRWASGNTQDVSSRLVLVSGSTATFDTNSNTVTLGTSFGSNTSAALTKTGAGTLVLNGANTYTGVTTVNAGTLQAAANALANTSSIAVNGAYLSAVNYNSSASLALNATGSAAISGAGLSLGAVTNNNTTANGLDFTGATGTITLASLSGAGNTRFQSHATIIGGISQGTISAAGLLTASISGGSVTAGSLSASTVSGGSVTATGAATITTLSAGSISAGGLATITTMSGGTAGLAGSSASITTLSGGRINLSNNVALSVQDGTFGGLIAGAGSLTKKGVGSLALSAANTYSGATTIESGTLQMAALNAIASSSGVTLGSGGSQGTFDLNGHDQDVRALTFASLGGTVKNATGSGELFMKNLATGTATITVQSSTANSISTTLQLASNTVIDVGSGGVLGLLESVKGTGSLTKSGSGTLTLHGNNSFSGGTYITGGSVVVAGGATPFGTGAITLSDFTTLDLGGQAITNSIAFASNSATVAILNSGTFLDLISSGNVSSGVAPTITADYRVTNGAVIDFQSPLAGKVQVDSGKGLFAALTSPGVATVAGGAQAVFSGTIAGSVTTSGSSLFSGPILHQVTVTGGTSTFTGASLTGASVDVNGGRAIFSGTVGGIAHVGNGGTAEFSNRMTGGLTVDAGGLATLGDGATYESGDLENAGTLVFNRTAGNNLTLATTLGGTGSFVKQGASTLTLTGANDFTGSFTVSSGTLQIGSGGSSGSIVGNVVNNAALVFNRTGTSTFAGNISGTGLLRKLGAGTVKLSGSHSHSGGTTVSEGTLSVNGYLGGSALVVESGAAIGGSGLIAGGITGDGQIGPGNSPGILTTPSITPTQSTSFAFEFTQLGAPTWSTSTASGNDVLRLTDPALPFVGSLGASNVVNVYLSVSSLSINDTFLGGFFTDKSGDFSTFINDATFNFYVLGNGSGTATTYNGVGYYDLTSWAATNLSGFTKVGISTVASGTTNFASGTISTGQVTQFVIIPEPDTIIFAGIGIAMAGWSLWKRRRIAHILRK